MKAEYYTPTIEEFYVGFEYEGLEEFPYPEKEEWVTFEYEGNCEELMVENRIEQGRIRVKYLDEQDLIEVGLIDGQPWGMNCFMFEDKTAVLGKLKKPLIHGPQIVFHSWQHVKIYLEHSNLAFIIKNKSELLKLFTQIQLGLI